MDGDFRLAEWLICPKLNTIQGQNAAPVRVEPKVMQVLVCLANRPAEVVSKEHLMREVWPDTFVTDDVLTRAISELRRVLGDDAKHPRYIETIAKGGYRVIAPVEPVVSSSALATQKSTKFTLPQRRIAAVVTLLAAATIIAFRPGNHAVETANNANTADTSNISREHSLAVLPMENLSHDPQQDYFADAMTDELINELAQLKALRVVSRTSVMQFRGSNRPLAEIAKVLNVDTVVEGAVLRSGDRVRITAELVDVKSDKQIWAKKYDRDLHDVLALQGDVAAAIADEIRVNVSPQEQAQLASARPVDPQAYELYLQGFNLLWNQGPFENGPHKALEFFERAIAKDPNLTMAYVRIADCHIFLVGNGFEDPIQGYQKVADATAHALQLDPQSSDVHRTLGALREYQHDWEGSRKEYELAVRLGPNSALAHHWLALRLDAMGLFDQAIAEARRAIEIDPAGNYYRFVLATVLVDARQYESAVAVLRQVLDVAPNDFPSLDELAEIQLLTGHSREALDTLEKAHQNTPDKSALDWQQAWAYALAGKREQALRIVQKMRNESKTQYMRPTDFAAVYCALGDRDETFVWLEKAFAQRDVELQNLRVDAKWDSIRSDPRFENLARREGL
jgi:TolB-like protein/DNA-binding winged helix-turn-helix (wHTH) protein/Tfp pilus assembly protein PilF